MTQGPTRRSIWGTGNPVPMFDPQYRPGDNLYSNSDRCAGCRDSGKLKWYFQYTPGDYHDYDEVGTQQLVDLKINGEDRKVLAHFGRNGIFYTLDRSNGSFIQGTPYVNKLNWTKGLDPKTGKPVDYDPNKDLQTYARVAELNFRKRGAGEEGLSVRAPAATIIGRRPTARARSFSSFRR